MTNEELAQRYRQLYAGVVYDAMVFDCGIPEQLCVVSRKIQRIEGARRTPLAGPAMTCWGAADNPYCSKKIADNDRVRLDMLDCMAPGCVQVISTFDDRVAHFGDVSASLAKTRGAVGVVIDGYSRDVDRINHIGLPLFCRGSQPQDAFGRWGILGFGETISLHGIGGSVLNVAQGDWIFADGDGVLVIPETGVTGAEGVLVLAEKRKANEDEVRAAVLNGEEPKGIYERLGRW